MKPLNGFILSVTALVFLAGCSSTAHIEKDETADLSSYKSYTWIETKDQAETKKGVTDLGIQNIKNSVNLELEKNGWKEVKENPDLLLSYDVLVEKNIRKDRDAVYSQPTTRLYYNPYTRRYNSIYYPSRFLGYEENETPVKEGTVTISMIDPKTDKTIWQGWTTDEINSSKLTSKEIQRNVKSIFKKFDVEK